MKHTCGECPFAGVQNAGIHSNGGTVSICRLTPCTGRQYPKVDGQGCGQHPLNRAAAEVQYQVAVAASLARQGIKAV